MEDAHAAVLDLQSVAEDGKESKPADINSRLSFFGVYDGHGGDKVAQFSMVSMPDGTLGYGKLTCALQTHGTRKKFPAARLP
jgi:serine/threonine protein phosphatase PrpC